MHLDHLIPCPSDSANEFFSFESVCGIISQKSLETFKNWISKVQDPSEDFKSRISILHEINHLNDADRFIACFKKEIQELVKPKCPSCYSLVELVHAKFFKRFVWPHCKMRIQYHSSKIILVWTSSERSVYIFCKAKNLEQDVAHSRSVHIQLYQIVLARLQTAFSLNQSIQLNYLVVIFADHCCSKEHTHKMQNTLPPH
jgi:hypothetical protein